MAQGWQYSPKEINVKRGIGYGLTDLMGGGWNNIVSGVIFAYLTLTVHMDPGMAGALTGIGRIVDAIFSLFFGSITDNFYRSKLGKKFGRRHFFMVVGIIGFAVVFPMFWVPATAIFGPGKDFLYYLIVYCLMEVIIAMILIPWETLPTEMTEDYTKRTILSGSRMVISAIGTTIVFFVLAILQTLKDPNAYLIAGVLWTILFVVAMTISWRTTWERELDEKFIAELDARPKLSIGQYLAKTVKDYASTFKNKSFRKHLAVYLLSFTGKDFYATLLPTFIVVAAGSAANVPWVLNSLALFGIFSTLAAAKLMISKGPRFLFELAYSGIILALVGYVATYFLHVSNPFIIFVIITIVYQASRGILEFTPWNVFPFIPDVDRMITREDRAGTYAAVMTFFRKSTGAAAAWIAGLALEAIGYNATATTQTGAVKDGIALIFFIGPVVLIALALVVALTFRLNKQTHEVLKTEMHRLEAGGAKADVTPEAKQVTEALTGHPYEELWPDKLL
ncbi:MAG: MFS transporter [Lactobacillaceae bacterium]|jgi:oligogalacturonide transporter|nr:MFS transporter [Lactobacillaceae bacterium]